MTDAHYHRDGYGTYLSVRGKEVRFLGIHPWETSEGDIGAFETTLADIRERLEADREAGVGEIGLDRLRTKSIPPIQRELFARQLAVAAELRRPVVLHGAKCWGEVVAACRPHRGAIPAFLFHGFSRSIGLLPDIKALNGFISIGPALLNDHAVNYRAMARELPLERTLLETDMDRAGDAAGADATLRALVAAFAALRGENDIPALEARLADNAARFLEDAK